MAAVLPVGAFDAGPPAPAPVTHALALTCIVATVVAAMRPDVVAVGGVVPAAVWGGAPGVLPPALTFATAPWLHASALHLLYNLAALWVFGPPVERQLGGARFAALVLGTGVASLVSQTVVMPGSTTPIVGASGMTAALLGAFLVLHGQARVSIALLFLTVPVPVRALAAIWVGGEFLTVVATAAGWFPPLPVAHVAHLAGFALGAAILRFRTGNGDFSFLRVS